METNSLVGDVDPTRKEDLITQSTRKTFEKFLTGKKRNFGQ